MDSSLLWYVFRHPSNRLQILFLCATTNFSAPLTNPITYIFVFFYCVNFEPERIWKIHTSYVIIHMLDPLISFLCTVCFIHISSQYILRAQMLATCHLAFAPYALYGSSNDLNNLLESNFPHVFEKLTHRFRQNEITITFCVVSVDPTLYFAIN